MKNDKEKLSEKLGWYIINNDTTIRETAEIFRMPRTTVHGCITRLKEYNSVLYAEVHTVLQRHLEEAPQRGGKANKKRWKLLQETQQ